jgi:hypothetical protein
LRADVADNMALREAIDTGDELAAVRLVEEHGGDVMGQPVARRADRTFLS